MNLTPQRYNILSKPPNFFQKKCKKNAKTAHFPPISPPKGAGGGLHGAVQGRRMGRRGGGALGWRWGGVLGWCLGGALGGCCYVEKLTLHIFRQFLHIGIENL